MEFNNLGIIPPLLKAVNEIGYTATTEIQEQAIPLVLAGHDIIGCAQTGTGKTGAFGLPILQLLAADTRKSKMPRALILAPTRELALQIDQSFASYSAHLPINHVAIYGGVSINKQITSLQKGVDILVATPGRLLDLINQKQISIAQVQLLVLDEADNMLDMGFIHDLKRIFKFLPEKRQNLLFSATMPDSIRKFANTILKNPKEVSVTPVSSTAKKVGQTVHFVEKKEKAIFLSDVLHKDKLLQTLVFTRTKHGADRLSKLLGRTGIQSVCIHGNKSQPAREKALASFKNGSVKILIATDIAARGIDIQDLPQVVNYDLPETPETYVHRIGRTGRAGKEGKALSLCSEEERPKLQKIQKLIGLQLTVI